MVNKDIDKQTKLAIIAAAMLSFLGILVETSLNVTFPTLAKELHVSLGTVQWVTSGYLLTVAVIMSTTGYLNQRFNAHNLFTAAITFNLVGTIICASAQNFVALISGRLLQAVSTGISTPLLFNLVLTLVPQSKRGSYMGFSEMVISFAPALGPTYGGTLTSFWSWRGIFIVALAILIITAIMGEKYIHLAPQGTLQKFDWLGVLLLTMMLGSLSTAFTNAGKFGFTSFSFIGLLLVSVVIALVLAWHLHRSSRKILNFRLLKQPLVALRWVNYFILAFINIGISFVIPIFVEDCLHQSSFIAGLLLLPGALVGAFVSPLAGKIFDHGQAFSSMLWSSLIMLTGSLLFFGTTGFITTLTIGIIYILMRGGFNLGFSNTLSDASLQITRQENAALNSLFNTTQQYAGSFGTSVLSAVIATTQSHGGSLAASTALGSKLDYGILAVLCVISLITVVWGRVIVKRQ
ncbi:MFS transporter [Lactobacillus sp. ESL0679]|uniref:MFS transporter n=1 Tax=Lactobacillus sp. ESL0679 TaxID=2983209 RepID=UPI0023F7522F|nr:MFS transporter [Lactobacillus sp. ESL0679]MDF7682833.1 MFS transporter [Lactobacillus sp. ESL0679]